MFARSKQDIDTSIIDVYNKLISKEIPNKVISGLPQDTQSTAILLLARIKPNFLLQFVNPSDISNLEEIYKDIDIVIKTFEHEGLSFQIIGTKEKEVNKLYDLHIMQSSNNTKIQVKATEQIGRLLGYPVCCTYKSDIPDFHFHKYSDLLDPNGYFFKINSPWPFYNNNFTPFKTTHHCPCSPRCQKTRLLSSRSLKVEQLVNKMFTEDKIKQYILSKSGFVLKFQDYLFTHFYAAKKQDKLRIKSVKMSVTRPDKNKTHCKDNYYSRINLIKSLSINSIINVTDQQIILEKGDKQIIYNKKDKSDGVLIEYTPHVK